MQEVSPLEALAAAHDACNGEEREVWGIEVCVSVRDNTRPHPHPQGIFGVHAPAQGVGMKHSASNMARHGGEGGGRRDSNASASSMSVGLELQSSSMPSKADIRAIPARSSLAASHGHSNTSPIRPSERQVIGQKRKVSHAYSHSLEYGNDRALSARDMNASASSNGGKSGNGRMADKGTAIPSALYKDPTSLTQEQAKRLLESPSFLELLERTANKPASTRTERTHAHRKPTHDAPVLMALPVWKEKGTAGSALTTVPNAKRVKHNETSARGGGKAKLDMKCWNCGRTKSSVWRSRTMEDGTAVRVCNGTFSPSLSLVHGMISG